MSPLNQPKLSLFIFHSGSGNNPLSGIKQSIQTFLPKPKLDKWINIGYFILEKSLINKDALKNSEINWLNSYHKEVFNNLKKFMNKSELLELKLACSKI